MFLVSTGAIKKEPPSTHPSPRGKEKPQKEGWSGKERERGQGRGRGRGREIITSSSVFSMGPGTRQGAGVCVCVRVCVHVCVFLCASVSLCVYTYICVVACSDIVFLPCRTHIINMH